MRQPRPTMSVIVVSYHSGPSLDLCLQALLACDTCHEIVLVNNGNPDLVLEGLRTLARHNPKLTLIHGHGNIGFGQGCNLGAGQSRGDILVFVNPDCIIDPQCLAAFDDALASHPNALLGGALRNVDGSEQRGARRGELTLWSAFVSFAGLGRPGIEAGIWRDFNRNREAPLHDIEAVPVVSGALMAITRARFAALGGFDPHFFLHVEDIDLCKRAAATGMAVLLVPKASALHIGGTSATTSWALARAKIASFFYYFWTHAGGILERIMVLAVMPLLAAAIIARAQVSPKHQPDQSKA
jgi:N-acetylglucosaminyl-diphospho-decaprenol L-rhamnosyltransferase